MNRDGLTTGWTTEDIERELRQAREQVRRAEEHKQDLESILKRKKHTHATRDGIEEAIALCVSILRDEELASLLREQKLWRLRDVLSKVHESPTAYKDEECHTLPGLREWLDDFEEYREARQRTPRG